MEKYVVLDLENPNIRANSICSISILVVEKNEIVKEIYSLINPEDRFDLRNFEINGIIESDVIDKPTFEKFWNDNKDLLINNIIVGHGVEYDLSVISKSLLRYDIDYPTFKYIDTLELAKKYMNLDSYKLTSISDYLNYEYNAHNALDDTKATFNLYNYLLQHYDLKNDYNEYKYTYELKNKIDDKLSSNINDLYGIIKGINYDGIINQKEIDLLKKWVDENSKYKQYSTFNNIIITLNSILKDNIIDEYERIQLSEIVTNINESKLYTETTLNLQILEGILKGIECDKTIDEREIFGLKKWLEINDYLTGVYPYDKIVLVVNDVLEDAILTDEEKSTLLKVFEEIINPIKSMGNELPLEGRTFCLTGEFKTGSKNDIKSKLENYGASEKSGVSSKLDYLFVGGLGSDAWKFGKVGGKIAKAQELQEKGSNIKIISEEEMLNLIN